MAASNIKGDRRALQRTMEAILAQSCSTQSSLTSFESTLAPLPSAGPLPDRVAELVFDMPARRRLSEMTLPPDLVTEITEFIHECSHTALLRSHSLEPRHTVLMVGPPGNGKTTLAEVIATELSLPLLAIRYDAVVDSFLGETSNRFRSLTDWAALNPCVLFFDEFDAVGKERSDAQETGEIKRVVGTLLMQLDRLPSHAIVVCATNHPELLDRAVWRRFELKLSIDKPTREQLIAWFDQLATSLRVDLGISPEKFAEIMAGENMSEVEAFTLDVRRQLVLSEGRMTPPEAVQKVLGRISRRLKHFGEKRGDGNTVSAAKSRKRSTSKKTRGTEGASLFSPGQDLISGSAR